MEMRRTHSSREGFTTEQSFAISQFFKCWQTSRLQKYSPKKNTQSILNEKRVDERWDDINKEDGRGPYIIIFFCC